MQYIYIAFLQKMDTSLSSFIYALQIIVILFYSLKFYSDQNIRAIICFENMLRYMLDSRM